MADNKPSTGGPKTSDSKRDQNVTPERNQAGADLHTEEARGRVFGDNTSSTGGANNPGQHGRDGGEIGSVVEPENREMLSNNPAPSEAVVENEEGARQQQQLMEQEEQDRKANEPKSQNTTPKKL